MAPIFVMISVWAIQLYFLAGLIIGLLFIIWGIGKVDHVAQQSSIWFRLIVLPGSILLWPVVLLKWMKSLQVP